MTDEQIKQNAEEYAEQNKVNFSEDKYFEVYDYVEQKEAYIAGAHSRDEEINELEKKVSALETVIVTARATISTQEAIIKDLRNPLISVNERLPEDVGKVVIVLTDMGDIFNSFLFRNKRGSLIWNSDKGIGKPIFWMPIPQTKKLE